MKTIKLTQGKIATVCDCHYDLVNDYKWYYRKNNTNEYAETKTSSRGGIRRRTLRMHRLVCQPPSGLVTDHKDGDGLNNQCSNLRSVTHSQNSMNTRMARNNKSGVKGVCWSNVRQMWRASIMYGGKQHLLGHFNDLSEAAKVREEAEMLYHGEFRKA